MTAERVRVAARVRGWVQGVSYRAGTARAAERLGLTGWVRNEDDGSVSLEAQGERGQVDKLLAWCAKGPPMAEVSGVDVEWLEVKEGEIGFRIRF